MMLWNQILFDQEFTTREARGEKTWKKIDMHFI